MLDSALREQILSSVRARPSPTRGQGLRRTAWVLGAGVATGLSALALGTWLAGRDGGPLRPTPAGVAALGGTLAIALLAAVAAFGRGRSMLARPAWVYRLSLLSTPYALALWRLAVEARLGEGRAAPATSDWAGALACLALTLLAGAPPLLALAWERRDLEPTRAGPVGAAAGVALGALATVLVGLRCAAGPPPHHLAGHALPVLLLGLLGEVLGRRWMATRATAPSARTPRQAAPSATLHGEARWRAGGS